MPNIVSQTPEVMPTILTVVAQLEEIMHTVRESSAAVGEKLGGALLSGEQTNKMPKSSSVLNRLIDLRDAALAADSNLYRAKASLGID